MEDSQKQVEMGKHLAGRAGAAVKAIVSNIHEMSAMMSEIAQAGDVQAKKISTVNHVIEQMNNMTQQNAALVEESAAAAEVMREQAEQLAAVIGAFSLASD